MKRILMANSQKAFSKNLFAILESRYQGVRLSIVNDDNMTGLLKRGRYDLAIVNSNMDALTLSNESMLAGLDIPILVYTETTHLPFIKKLYKLGVSGVLHASAGDHEVLKAVTDVLAKRIYISECIKQELIRYSMVANGNIDDLGENNSLSNKSDVENFGETFPLASINNSIIAYKHCLN